MAAAVKGVWEAWFGGVGEGMGWRCRCYDVGRAVLCCGGSPWKDRDERGGKFNSSSSLSPWVVGLEPAASKDLLRKQQGAWSYPR